MHAPLLRLGRAVALQEGPESRFMNQHGTPERIRHTSVAFFETARQETMAPA